MKTEKERKEHKRAYMKKWRIKNREKIQISQKKYFEKNRDKCGKMANDWYNKNREKRIKTVQAYQKKTSYASEKTEKQRKIRYIKRRTRQIYPLEGHNYEFCGKKATERHHNTTPIKVDNFNYVCPNCHKIANQLLKGGIYKNG